MEILCINLRPTHFGAASRCSESDGARLGKLRTHLLFNQRVAFFPRKVISAVPVEKGQYLKTGSVSGQRSVFQAIIPSRGNPKFALKCFLLTVPERLVLRWSM